MIYVSTCHISHPPLLKQCGQVRVNALKRAQAQVADAEQRALQDVGRWGPGAAGAGKYMVKCYPIDIPLIYTIPRYQQWPIYVFLSILHLSFNKEQLSCLLFRKCSQWEMALQLFDDMDLFRIPRRRLVKTGPGARGAW